MMTETVLGPEAQELLPNAVREVSGLYLGDQFANSLRTQPPELRDQIWAEYSQEFGPFSERITALREALKTVDVTKRGYPEQVTRVMSMNFSTVDDEAAKLLLTDILIARVTTTPGYMDYGMKPVEEARAMEGELGAGESLSSEQMKNLDLTTVVGKVLTGDLKLTRQTQLESKQK